MKLIINNETVDVMENIISVEELMKLRGIPQQGTAIAVNDMIVGRDKRASHLLKDGDRLMVITAAYGG